VISPDEVVPSREEHGKWMVEAEGSRPGRPRGTRRCRAMDRKLGKNMWDELEKRLNDGLDQVLSRFD
jgi:hypothetical protein